MYGLKIKREIPKRRKRLKYKLTVTVMINYLLILYLIFITTHLYIAIKNQSLETTKIDEFQEIIELGDTGVSNNQFIIEDTQESPSQSPISLGTYKITAYCIENYPHICNNGDSTYTATGEKPIPNKTIAVDPKIIPYGSTIIIDGNEYYANDTGGAIKGNRIDICCGTHEEALNIGVKIKEVFKVGT